MTPEESDLQAVIDLTEAIENDLKATLVLAGNPEAWTSISIAAICNVCGRLDEHFDDEISERVISLLRKRSLQRGLRQRPRG